MMETLRGRRAKTMAEAQEFIWDFIYETLQNPAEGSYGKTGDFDLFLPYMMSWVLNVPHGHEELFTPTRELELLYMDAAWDLCLNGFLRPGTRATSGEGMGGEYGKGYSLTPGGRETIANRAKFVVGQDHGDDLQP